MYILGQKKIVSCNVTITGVNQSVWGNSRADSTDMDRPVAIAVEGVEVDGAVEHKSQILL